MTTKKDMYQEVTDRIVEAIENTDGKNWKCPWQGSIGLPRNGATQRPYNGVNVLLLWIITEAKGYRTHEWFTYKQAKGLGGNVKRGEKGTQVVYWGFREVPKDPSMSLEEFRKLSKEEQKKIGMRKVPNCRAYTVFNRDQCEGLPEAVVENHDGPSSIEAIENFVSETGVQIVEGPLAAYAKSRDHVILPNRKDFFSEGGYYSTLFHEMTHWTGHDTRLDRDLSGRFGSESYAMEELVAELGSAFLCASFGIEAGTQHPEYIKSWLQVLKNDKYAIFTAAREAKNAVDYLNGKRDSQEDSEETDMPLQASA
jgi:antirestriction protein ArdC